MTSSCAAAAAAPAADDDFCGGSDQVYGHEGNNADSYYHESVLQIYKQPFVNHLYM